MGEHKCVQHFSLLYAHQELYFLRQTFIEYSVIKAIIFIHQTKETKT
jgi:hypothetical protein